MIRLIIGPPCAGKTSYIGAHARKGDVRLDWDKLAAALDAHASGTHTARDGAVRAVATYGRIILGHYLRTRWRARRDDDTEATAWIPVTSPQAVGGLEDYIAAGAKVTILDPGIDTCLERCKTDGRPEGTEQAIREWYEQPPTIPDAWLYQDDQTKEEGGRVMRAKNIQVSVKALAGEASAVNPFGGEMLEGDFIAYAATFDDDPDSYGDIITPGAFKGTLERWAKKDAPIPLLYGHKMDDPAYNIGHIVEAREDEKGLLVWGRIDLELEKGQLAYRLIKSRRLNQLSFAFDALDYEENKDTGGYVLNELELHEVSLVQMGANRHTSVLAVKSAVDVVQTVKGEFTSDEVDALTDAAENLREALAQIEALLGTTKPEPEPEPSSSEDSDGAANTQPAEPGAGSAKAANVAAARLRLAAAIAATH